MSTRLCLTIAGAAAVVSLAGASTAAAADPVVTLTASSKYAYAGANVTLKISSDTAGPITVVQERRDKSTGPGRCAFFAHRSPDGFVGGKALKTINYTTPGQVITVTLAGGSLEFYGGDIFSGLNPNAECVDPATPFSRIAAFVTSPVTAFAYEATKPLGRIF